MQDSLIWTASATPNSKIASAKEATRRECKCNETQRPRSRWLNTKVKKISNSTHNHIQNTLYLSLRHLLIWFHLVMFSVNDWCSFPLRWMPAYAKIATHMRLIEARENCSTPMAEHAKNRLAGIALADGCSLFSPSTRCQFGRSIDCTTKSKRSIFRFKWPGYITKHGHLIPIY